MGNPEKFVSLQSETLLVFGLVFLGVGIDGPAG
jgi:hypothetical protein